MIDARLEHFIIHMRCPLCNKEMREASSTIYLTEVVCVECGLEIRLREEPRKKLQRDKEELRKLRRVLE